MTNSNHREWCNIMKQHCSSVITSILAWVLLYVHRNRRLIRDGSPGRPPRLSHSFWALLSTFTCTAFSVIVPLVGDEFWFLCLLTMWFLVLVVDIHFHVFKCSRELEFFFFFFFLQFIHFLCFVVCVLLFFSSQGCCCCIHYCPK